MIGANKAAAIGPAHREAANAPFTVAVSKIRLIILRAMYVFIVVGVAVFVWPTYLSQLPGPSHFNGIVLTMLAAFSILCVLGIRYPLQMIPILLWELLWKSMWLLLIALPRWLDGTMDTLTSQTVVDCLVGVVLVPLALPWSYVVANYVKGPSDRLARSRPCRQASST
ncbi:MAG: hypothetical protein AVDCRST_MAG93-2908 [uncultured Chloroflexia bacterium]|uniref:Uncharacterized protein n=1 Tax=uncultured Chloroflexia bacterium TaxID=1672391 RepID=A0A6J4JC58_9CHLR|nr:MAG: hypothetical protein AVDCRST_MAG93-2908 [uncultured Chloroflexia bacterium]